MRCSLSCGLKWLLTCKCTGKSCSEQHDLLIWDNVMRRRFASAHVIHVASGPYNELECQCKWENSGPNCCPSVVTTLNEMKGLYSMGIDALINTEDWWNDQNGRRKKRRENLCNTSTQKYRPTKLSDNPLNSLNEALCLWLRTNNIHILKRVLKDV